MREEDTMTETEARAVPEPEENTEEQEELAIWFEDRKYSGLLDE